MKNMRIYTYKNAIQLEKSEYWDELKKHPHFCSSEVLSIGMKNFYGRKNFSCLSTIDKLINVIFPTWMATNNEVKRYKDISKYINELDNDKIESNIIYTFKKNKRNVLEAIKYIFETEDIIKESGYDTDIFNSLEVKSSYILDTFKTYILKNIIEQVSYKDYWRPDWIIDNYTENSLNNAIHECNIIEIKNIVKKVYNLKKSPHSTETSIRLFEDLFDKFGKYNPKRSILNDLGCEKDKLLTILGYSDIELEYIRNNTIYKENNYSFDKIVIHGLYRFKPIHIRLIKELESAGYEVIVLNCYNDDYKKVYSCWNELYINFSKVFPISSIKQSLEDDVTHRNIGILFGDLVEGKKINIDKTIKYEDVSNNLNINYQHKFDIFNEKDNYSKDDLLLIRNDKSKYSESVNMIIDDLIQNSKLFLQYNSTMEFVNYVSKIFDLTKDTKEKRHIGKMKEQFYGVNGTEMNKIFNVFYPDEFGVKPFLSYPIGQFILSLYNMWDIKQNRVILNNVDLIECLNLEVWHQIIPIKIYDKIKDYIGLDKEINGLSVNDFLTRIDNIINLKKHNYIKDLEKFSFFNIDIEALEKFKQVILNIERIACRIFESSDNQTSQEHYSKMIKILNDEKEWKELSSEEKKLIKEIDNRLDSISEDEEKSDLDTIKDTLSFYLANDIGSDINWLVRDLDQIEGDILSEAARAKKSELDIKCYHYSLISNENMLENNLEILPWPLTKEFILNKDLLNLFESIIGNNVKYKRCLLFQGLYYLIYDPIIKLKLSYIKNDGDNINSPYYLLNQIVDVIDYSEKDFYYNPLVLNYKDFYYVSEKSNLNKTWDVKASEVMSCCPRKFMYSYGLDNPSEQYLDEIQVKMYFGRIINRIIINEWNEINNNYSIDSKLKVKTIKEKISSTEFYQKIKEYLGEYINISELKSIIDTQYNYLIENNMKVNFDEQLINCWNKKVGEYDLFKLPNGTPIYIPNRIKFINSNYSEYINKYLLHQNEGLDLKKSKNGRTILDKYKVSKYICMYCSFKNICLYSNRINAQNILKD